MPQNPRLWDQRPYHTLSYSLKKQFKTRVYKLSLDGGMTCPNRDGTLGTGGCIFCSKGGSGDFAESCRSYPDIAGQIEAARKRIERKAPSGPYIAYFQSFTNTYAPLPYLSDLFSRTLDHPQIAALSIGTRPDCLEDEKIRLLAELNRKKPVWVELGLQTIHPNTAALIRRGYPLSCFADTAARLKEAGLTVIVHLILGLPGESREQMLSSVDYTAHFLPALDGIKLQLLHVLKGTDLAAMYEKDPFPLFSMEEYADFIVTCIEHLPPSMTVHRITGDGPRSLLIAPEWSLHKRQVLNTIDRRFRERNTFQGAKF
ncbi:MAG TPA: TIGR01212 family radical SAM protein [Candidatus Caccovicinus merdipullorum]|uniref:TIGR01212 family radical SAM protein n=1 Tax=Candidatus Caccovicinus merdipullorum TaxID=2840724 RepID=A0A9D1GKQ1_9FIRM|nr:TIGR01212 family radical SAM protein [Candidatus Caccovicinus merdipullorum]